MANIFEINRPSNKITLGTTDTTINIASHTASKILALDTSKDLEVVTIGTSLDYTRPTLNAIQDIRTSASPQFVGIELGHASDTTITRVSAGVIAVEGTNVMLAGDAPTAHTHDTDTLQLDGVNSDGGAFSFTTSGTITFNQSIATANYTATNKLTACVTNAGALDFSAASKTLTVEDNAIVSQDYSSNAIPTFAGLALDGDIVFSGEKTIRQSTSDGVDNKATYMGGGGAIAPTRGGYISLYGNEHSITPGDIYLVAGGVTDGDIHCRAEGAVVDRLTITAEGIVVSDSVYIKERAAAQGDIAAYGQIWVKNDTPNILMFTDDAGTDYAISPDILTSSTAGPTDNVNVSGINTLFIDNSSNAVVIGGFAGGVDGQVLHIVLINAGANNVTLEHNEGGATQPILLHAGADETLNTEYGGWVLVCHGGVDWHDCSHSKHV